MSRDEPNLLTPWVVLRGRDQGPRHPVRGCPHWPQTKFLLSVILDIWDETFVIVCWFYIKHGGLNLQDQKMRSQRLENAGLENAGPGK